MAKYPCETPVTKCKTFVAPKPKAYNDDLADAEYMRNLRKRTGEPAGPEILFPLLVKEVRDLFETEAMSDLLIAHDDIGEQGHDEDTCCICRIRKILEANEK